MTELSEYTDVHTEKESVLDLSTRVSPERKRGTVSSPILMPPPKGIPKHCPPPPQLIPKSVTQMPLKAIPPRKVFNENTSSKLTSEVPSTVEQVNTNTVKRTDTLNIKKFVRCSVPRDDVHCYVTKNTHCDELTRSFVRNQIAYKIYTKPSAKKCPEESGTPKKSGEDSITPTKCPDESQSGTDVKDATEPSKPKMKINMKHFNMKNMKVEDIAIDAEFGKPMRCSTPTPGDTSTIMAGHLDFTIDGDYFDETFTSDKQEDDGNFIDMQKKNEEKKEEDRAITNKNSYCEDWMKKEKGVSTTNSDIAPSIF